MKQPTKVCFVYCRLLIVFSRLYKKPSNDLPMPYNIIDTHIHTWDLQRADYPWLQGDTSLLNQNWYLDALEKDRVAAGIGAGILVQAAGNEDDTQLMLETAAKHDWIKGVVAWLPLTNPQLTAKLLEEVYLPDPYFKGVRHQVHDEPDTRWLLQPTVLESLALLAAHNIPFDFVGVLPAHIETALEVATKVPSLQMVFDHLNQPPIASKELGVWGNLMKEAASHKNLYAKISGLGTASGNLTAWQPADLKPYIAFVIEQFGGQRCFCGGDWPVNLLAGSYIQIWSAYKTIIPELVGKAAAQQIFYDNAVRFYHLQPCPTCN